MELMSPMFLCALVALLPQALGKSSRKFTSVSDLVNDQFKDEKQLYDTNSVTKLNVTTNIHKVSDLQSVFMNPICKECHNCMELSIKAHKVHSHINTEIKTNDVNNEIDYLQENTTHRNKRNLGDDTDIKLSKKSAKKSKAKKSKNNKSVSVSKYSDEGKVYALKVRDTTTPTLLDFQNQTNAPVSKCQVYRVTEVFSCNSPEAELILSEKRKINKTNKKEKRNNDMNLPINNKETDRTVVPQFKKRQVVDEGQVPENFMPSIEEMY